MTNQIIVSNNLTSYLNFIGSQPIISEKEEIELGKEVYHKKDVDAAKKLVLSHLRFVVFVAKKYKNYGLPLEDLIQEGNIGLMKAIQNFNPYKGVRLAAFAIYYIKHEIHEFIIRNWKIVKVATTKAQRKLFFNLRSMKKSLTHSSEKERHEIAKELNVTIEEVRTMEQRMYANNINFDSVIDSQDENGEYTPNPATYLYDENDNPEKEYEEIQYKNVMHVKLYDALNKLPEREKDIILTRMLSEKPKTLSELSKKYNVSMERIRQLEKNAIKKLKKEMVEN